MPFNGETATIATNPNIPVDISLGLLKKETALSKSVCFFFPFVFGTELQAND